MKGLFLVVMFTFSESVCLTASCRYHKICLLVFRRKVLTKKVQSELVRVFDKKLSLSRSGLSRSDC